MVVTMKKAFFLLCLFCIPFSVSAQERATTHHQRAYAQNPHVSPEVWEKTAPYFLPDDHPAKPFLDQIFSSQRITLSRETALQAGFFLTDHQGQQTTVMRHPGIPNYIIKVYFDNELAETKELEHWIKRIEGAKAVQAAIVKRKYGSLFVVPQKWIYPLPADPSLPAEGNYLRKNFVLIAEHMPLMGGPENKWRYRMEISRSKLRKLFNIVTDAGMYDSVRPSNVPWTYNKQIAFVDTEVYHQWPVDYHPMLEFINRDMKRYWQSLIEQEKTKKALRAKSGKE